ncbi:HAD family hydrolase [Companilactobacillus sp. DQM5]|uniref:HAD family hydrolase n=1 Tax=Companilactobacillus sp. DQM5 TaxID=3463359 RepID=UPI0040581B50
MIKHIFSDMDGTLLNEKGILTNNNAALIDESNIPLTLVSARSPIEMIDFIKELHLTDEQVAFNGGLIFKFEENEIIPIQENLLNISAAEIIVNELKNNFPNTSVSLYDTDHWYAEKIDFGIESEHKFVNHYPEIVEFNDLFTDKNKKLFKIMTISKTSKDCSDINNYFKQLNLPEVSFVGSGYNYFEFTSDKAKKSSGVKYILDSENLSYDQAAAFGDGHNDLPMLKLIGTPIVMANANDDIKKHAKYITKSNKEDGVGFGIHKYLL